MCIWTGQQPTQKWKSVKSNPLVGYKKMSRTEGGNFLSEVWATRWPDNQLKIKYPEPVVGDGPGIYCFKQLPAGWADLPVSRSLTAVKVELLGAVDEYRGGATARAGYKAQQARIIAYLDKRSGQWVDSQEALVAESRLTKSEGGAGTASRLSPPR